MGPELQRMSQIIPKEPLNPPSELTDTYDWDALVLAADFPHTSGLGSMLNSALSDDRPTDGSDIDDETQSQQHSPNPSASGDEVPVTIGPTTVSVHQVNKGQRQWPKSEFQKRQRQMSEFQSRLLEMAEEEHQTRMEILNLKVKYWNDKANNASSS